MNIISKIKLETHSSTNQVHFLDVTVFLNNRKLMTTHFTKPTDSYFYLNTSSCHPPYVPKSIPKEQFIRLRCICSEESEYLFNSKIMFLKSIEIERAFHEKE